MMELWIDGPLIRLTNGQLIRQMDGYMDRWEDGQFNRWTDTRMDGGRDRRMDGTNLIDNLIFESLFCQLRKETQMNNSLRKRVFQASF